MIHAILRGNVYHVEELPDPPGEHVQEGPRAAVVIQADEHNRFSSVSIVAVLTRTIRKRKRPNAVEIPAGIRGITPGTVLCDQIFTVGCEELTSNKYKGRLPSDLMEKIDLALCNALALRPKT